MNTKTSFTFISKDGKILMLQEGGKRAYGLWSFPGGHVDEGETFEQAAIREADEESGYQVTLGKEIFHALISDQEYKGSWGDTPEIEIKIFAANIIGGEMRLDEQALDIKWLSQGEALALPLRWGFIKELIKNYL